MSFDKAQQLFEDLTVADAQLQQFRAKHYGERVRDVLNELSRWTATPRRARRRCCWRTAGP